MASPPLQTNIAALPPPLLLRQSYFTHVKTRKARGRRPGGVYKITLQKPSVNNIKEKSDSLTRASIMDRLASVSLLNSV